MNRKIKKVTFLRYCIKLLNNKKWVRHHEDQNGNGLCFMYQNYRNIIESNGIAGWQHALNQMTIDFPELYAEIKKRRHGYSYAWKTDRGKLNFLKKFIKQY